MFSTSLAETCRLGRPAGTCAAREGRYRRDAGNMKGAIPMTEQETEKAIVRHHIERARRLIGGDAVVLGERLAIPLTPRGRECLRELLDEAERTL